MTWEMYKNLNEKGPFLEGWFKAYFTYLLRSYGPVYGYLGYVSSVVGYVPEVDEYDAYV